MAHKMAVLTDAETATGFRLAGVDVIEASDEASATRALEAVVTDGTYGLVAVDEGLLADPNRAVERSMRGRDLPVILSMPGLGFAFTEDQDATAYMKRLVRDTIGFDIKL